MSEADKPLLDGDDQTDELATSPRWSKIWARRQSKRRGWNVVQISVMILLIPLLLFFTLYLLWRSVTPVPSVVNPSEANPSQATQTETVEPPATNPGPVRDMKISLHPKDHVSREPGTRHFSWNITKAIRAPNGVKKEVYLINGLFPGPTIEARSGDILEIEIFNLLEEGVSFHWHGLHMRGANQMDGPVGITQCAIKPGSNFTYRVPIAEQTGTFWYHAHSEVQRGDGLFGGLVVHNPITPENSTYQYDEEILFMVGDWYHWQAEKVLAWFQDRTSMGNEPAPDSLLINGMGYFECSKATHGSPVDCSKVEHPSVSLDKTKRYRVRLANVGAMTGFSFTIPDSEINVIQVDGGQPVVSHASNSIGVLYPAERVDFTLAWPTSVSELDTKITIELDKEFFIRPNFALTPTQSFVLEAGTLNRNPPINETTEINRFNLQEAKGYPLNEPLPEAQAVFMIYITVQVMNQLDDEARALVNHTIWEPQSLPLVAMDRDGWDQNQLVPWTSSQPVWAELTINNVDVNGHPFHLHGFDFYVVASYGAINGFNAYNPFDPWSPPRGGPFNLVTPVRKDTVYVPPSGYVVLRFLADNEGIWALHCHVLWHQSSGMTMAIQVLGDEHKGFSENAIGKDAMQLCKI